ncbi:hypothetical protein THERMOT_902 [Bathymodiolus thermophilus thioautotrophic gill symbiont]|uniref:Uncharacterized protein n=1 Tax=Bathymodiolus thermophilus thioautotrophic gill symbiont TaxID=2360 RepID=A0A8H9CFU5_9GAMM|nr:hypothetical protein THERMOT_902 [Bathymodiolus thermophilus thioautotrophic gill symbiont]CAB5498980.1 hypothetical protein THERMOS_945 [Bathymodiolus thermophilus thioautotrophic gill symbiont]
MGNFFSKNIYTANGCANVLNPILVGVIIISNLMLTIYL